MKHSKAVIAALGLAGAAFAFPAAAQMRMPSMTSAYVGASLGQSKFHTNCDSFFASDCDDKDTAFRLFAGYQFHPNIAAELGYADLGKAKFSDAPSGFSTEMKATAWDLSALLMWPVMPQLQIFGRLGAYHGETKFSGDLTGKTTTTGFTWGLGGEWDFTRNIGARLEWQRYAKMKANCDVFCEEGKGDVDNLNLGIVYRFQ
jgi:OOP family OmpA-OmpF porin